MSKLMWVGENDRNIAGTSSKAYCLRRSGKTVVIKYGPVEVIGGGGGKTYWLGNPRTFPKPFKTVKQAKTFMIQQVTQKVEKGYDKLPGRARIRPGRM